MFKYQLWWVPSRLGYASFGWQPMLLGQFDSLGAAQEAAYIESCDEPAPDKHQYMYWHIQQITLH